MARKAIKRSIITAFAVTVCLTALLFMFGCTPKNTAPNGAGKEPTTAEKTNPTNENPNPTERNEGNYAARAVYKVRLMLTCTVKGDNGQDVEITCIYDGKTQSDIDGEELTVVRGEKFSSLKAAVPPGGNTVNSDEYRFVGWFYTGANGNETQVNENTPFTEELFGTATEVILKVRCERIFSPVMPL